MKSLCSEKVHVPASKPYISFIGNPNQASATVIRWHDKASDRDMNGGMVGTWNSASVTVESDYFCATEITFEAIRSHNRPFNLCSNKISNLGSNLCVFLCRIQ